MLTRENLGQLGAALVASSVGLHLVMLHHMAAAPALLMLALAAVCVPCGLALWRGGSTPAWTTTGVMASIMLVVHHGFALHEMDGHGTILSVLATATASAEVVLAIGALMLARAFKDCADAPPPARLEAPPSPIRRAPTL
jgi:hypothetical protein